MEYIEGCRKTSMARLRKIYDKLFRNRSVHSYLLPRDQIQVVRLLNTVVNLVPKKTLDKTLHQKKEVREWRERNTRMEREKYENGEREI